MTNKNPTYPVRVNAVAFTPAAQGPPQLWFGAPNFELPRVIEPHDAETIDVPVDYISETNDVLGPMFVGWIELKTGDIYRSDPHPQ